MPPCSVRSLCQSKIGAGEGWDSSMKLLKYDPALKSLPSEFCLLTVQFIGRVQTYQAVGGSHTGG